MSSAIGINWSLRYRKIIDQLKKKNEKLYNENQKMKRRLDKYESRRMTYYHNSKQTA